MFDVFKKTIKKHKKNDSSSLNDKLFTDLDKHRAFIQTNSEIIKMIPFEKLYLQSKDNLKLCGYFYKGKNNTKKTIICVHGYCSSPYRGFSAIGQYYIKKGYNVLMTNNRAHEESEGNYIGFGVLDRYDIKQWIEYINTIVPNTNIYLHGVSMGGGTVLMTSGLDLPDNVKGIIDDCGFTSPYEVFKRQIPTLLKLPPQPFLATLNLYTKLFAHYNLKESSVNALKKSKIPTIFIHGNNDIFVYPKMSQTNFDACNAPYKKIYFFENTGHSDSYMNDKAKFETAIEDLFDYNDNLEISKAK